MRTRKRVVDRGLFLGCANWQYRTNVSRFVTTRGARLVRKSSNRSKKIPLNSPCSKGEAWVDSPFTKGEVGVDSLFLEGEAWEVSPLSTREVLNPLLWKRRAGEDFTGPISFPDNPERSRELLLAMIRVDVGGCMDESSIERDYDGNGGTIKEKTAGADIMNG